jgi:hypothetical protein
MCPDDGDGVGVVKNVPRKSAGRKDPLASKAQDLSRELLASSLEACWEGGPPTTP